MLNKIVLYLMFIFIFVQILLILSYSYNFLMKHFIVKEINMIDRYGKDSWVLVTGCSSGQGKIIAIEFAKRNFNIILAGRKNILLTEKIIKQKYNVKTKCIIVDFCKSYEQNFFQPFTEFIDTIPNKLSILVNNVAYRAAWEPYDEMPESLINDTIACGTIVQARLTQIALKHFIKRQHKSAIINITAQCMYQNIWFGKTSEISVPYLSAYEAANAFGYYHSHSIQKEYSDRIDVLNITPGAVITENTSYLKSTPFSIDAEPFVKNIFKLLGNYQGTQCAYWGHDISNILSNFMFQYKDIILNKVGKTISQKYMELYKKKYK